jgi:hypothetical protein
MAVSFAGKLFRHAGPLYVKGDEQARMCRAVVPKDACEKTAE